MTIFNVDGTISVSNVASFDEARRIVEGYVEVVYIDHEMEDRALLINEEGLFTHPLNKRASEHFKLDLYGPVIFLRGVLVSAVLDSGIDDDSDELDA